MVSGKIFYIPFIHFLHFCFATDTQISIYENKRTITKTWRFMNKIYYLIIVCATLLLCKNGHAQQEGKISGVIRSQDNKAVEAATVTLVKARDTFVVKITVTDKTGSFEFEK